MQIIHQEGKEFVALSEDGAPIGRIVYAASADGKQLDFQHTIVDEDQEGKGVGKAILDFGVQYARDHGLQIIPSCPYVAARFKRDPAAYADVMA